MDIALYYQEKGNHFIANKRHVTFNKEVEDFLKTIQ